MITYDWQQRLKKECKEFLDVRIPANDFHVEIIYNAYPERVDGEIPPAIITFVARELAKTIVKNPDTYLEFILSLAQKKNGEGEKLFAIIVQKILVKYPREYDELAMEYINTNTRHEKKVKSLFDTIWLPVLKKHTDVYINVFFTWTMNTDSRVIIDNIYRILVTLLRQKKEYTKVIFQRSKSLWDADNEAIRMGNTKLLKALYKTNHTYYVEIYKEYSGTYEAPIAELLSSAIMEDSPVIRDTVERWNMSGNVRIKRAGMIAQKNISRCSHRKGK